MTINRRKTLVQANRRKVLSKSHTCSDSDSNNSNIDSFGRRQKTSTFSRPWIYISILLLHQQCHICHSLMVPSTSRQSFRAGSGFHSPSSKGKYRHISHLEAPSLFFSTSRRLAMERWKRQKEALNPHVSLSSGTSTSTSSSSSTALPMVLTTPESIIEQASTVNLLDDLIDESVRTSPRRPIMMQFDPSSGWIWRRWKGTIFSETWTTCVRNMIYASLIYFLTKKYPGVKGNLEGFGTLWGQLLSVTTFTLTFFVNQSYALWRKCYELSRRLQGRLHDIGMNLATHATRKVPTAPDEKSTYTAASRQILELMSRYIRLFDLLTYASFTRSHRPILTPRGMRRLVERGLMTLQEREVLVDAAIPATQRHSAILMWMIRLFVEGRASGHIQGGDGFEQQTMEKFHIIRAQYGAIGDELQGRMPLSYAHIVQILVDLILWMYPIMAFTIGMSPLVAILGTGLLTISYQGLFDLAKQFLDPYDNENYGKGEDPLSVDTLIAETNAGSVRWMYGFEEMPFSQEKLLEGELYDYLLPVRGYTVEELAQMEEEKIQREREAEEQRHREEEERLRKEAKEEEEKSEKAEMNDDEQEELSSLETPDSEDQGEKPSESEVASLENENESESILEEEPPMHKIFTLADGTVVSFTEEPDIIVKALTTSNEGKVAAPSPGVPNGAAPYLASLSADEKVETLSTLKTVEVTKSQEIGSSSQQIPENLPSIALKDTDTTSLTEDTEDRSVGEKMEAEDEIPAAEVTDLTSEGQSEEAAIDDLQQAVPIKDVSPTFEEEGDLENNRDTISSDYEKSTEPNETISTSASGGETIETADIEEGNKNGKSGDVVESAEASKVNEPDTAAPVVSEELKDAGAEDESPPARLTLADYNEQVEAIIELAKEELAETEAILNARPGYDPVGWDYDEEVLAPSTDGTEEDEEDEVVPEEVEEEDLVILEMDEPDDDEAMVVDLENKLNEIVDAADISLVDDSESEDEINPDSQSRDDFSNDETADAFDEDEATNETNPTEEELETVVENDPEEKGQKEIEENLQDGKEEEEEHQASDRVEPILMEEEGDMEGSIEDDEPESDKPISDRSEDDVEDHPSKD